MTKIKKVCPKDVLIINFTIFVAKFRKYLYCILIIIFYT